MYIKSLSIQNLKRLRDLSLDFTSANGEPRMWTVLIGENGTGKTSVLQAIALAAAGKLLVNDLAGNTFAHLVDRRQKGQMHINAKFSFTDSSIDNRKVHPLLEGSIEELNLQSNVTLNPKETSLRGEAWYTDGSQQLATKEDPLEHARARESPLWFVIGFGVRRALPESGRMPNLARPSVDRMKSLFDLEHSLTSTSFISHYGNRQAKARTYSNVLKRAITGTDILPKDIANLELRGYGGVTMAKDLLERDRFQQTMGPNIVKIPAIALAHGYQSTVAWIADLVGHILLEADTEIEPEEFEGLVLIDEIDLYLHPTWQARLIPALRKTFPKLQFVATTHSPVVLATLSPQEVVRLEADTETGHVRRIFSSDENFEVDDSEDYDSEEENEDDEDEAYADIQPDPRSMTGTELYREYFNLDRLTLNEHGEAIRTYTSLASTPFRTDYEQEEMEELHERLIESLITDMIEPVEREVENKDD